MTKHESCVGESLTVLRQRTQALQNRAVTPGVPGRYVKRCREFALNWRPPCKLMLASRKKRRRHLSRRLRLNRRRCPRYRRRSCCCLRLRYSLHILHRRHSGRSRQRPRCNYPRICRSVKPAGVCGPVRQYGRHASCAPASHLTTPAAPRWRQQKIGIQSREVSHGK